MFTGRADGFFMLVHIFLVNGSKNVIDPFLKLRTTIVHVTLRARQIKNYRFTDFIT